MKWNCRCFGFLKGSEIVSAGIQTKEACEKNELEKLAKAYETTAGFGSGAIAPQCCSWSFCNFNSTTLTSTDPNAPLLRQLEGILYKYEFANKRLKLRNIIRIHQ